MIALSLLILASQEADPYADFERSARQVVQRDAFPVLDDPPMLSVAEAERRGYVRDDDMVIGIARGGEARAYPIPIMGAHELGNDEIDGEPIAVSW